MVNSALAAIRHGRGELMKGWDASRFSLGRRPRFMPNKIARVFSARYYRHGAGYGIYVPPDLRTLANLLPGDVILWTYSYGVLCAIKATPDIIISREKATLMFEEIFREGLVKNERDRS